MVAAQRRHVAQQKVRHQHGHRATQVGVRGHERIARLLGLIRQRRNESPDESLKQRDAPPEIQPEIDRHLLVARATRVKPASGFADSLNQHTFDEAVHVLVGASDP